MDDELLVPENYLEGAVASALEGFGKGMTPKEAKEHILTADLLYVGIVDKSVIGFSSLNFKKEHAFLAGTVVRPAYRWLRNLS